MLKSKFIAISLFLFIASHEMGFAYLEEQVTAMAILNIAAEKANNNSLKTMFLRMSSKLRIADYKIPPEGKEFVKCSEATLAYTVPALSNTIYICNLLRSKSPGVIAQSLIHEAAHLVGYNNECDATRMEMAAMNISGLGIAFSNGYVKECGLD
jgi:hypothetical protein